MLVTISREFSALWKPTPLSVLQQRFRYRVPMGQHTIPAFLQPFKMFDVLHAVTSLRAPAEILPPGLPAPGWRPPLVLVGVLRKVQVFGYYGHP